MYVYLIYLQACFFVHFMARLLAQFPYMLKMPTMRRRENGFLVKEMAVIILTQ
jgi:hypothetical protein